MKSLSVEKPVPRGRLRSRVGREFYIFLRKLKWIINNHVFASQNNSDNCKYSLIRHSSVLLRPLRNVDMVFQHNKIVNLRLANHKLTNVLIKPGQIFSFWKLVGRPLKRKGYLVGLSLHNGKVTNDTGGGLCQLGNLIYWMALHSPLTVTERWRHGFDVFPDINRKIPFGCGATLAYNYVDLQLKNETHADFCIKLWLDDEFLNGEILSDQEPEFSYEIIETDHLMEHQWWGGYTRHNKIWRKETNIRDGSQKLVQITENHAVMMYNPLLEKNNSST